MPHWNDLHKVCKNVWDTKIMGLYSELILLLFFPSKTFSPIFSFSFLFVVVVVVVKNLFLPHPQVHK